MVDEPFHKLYATSKTWMSARTPSVCRVTPLIDRGDHLVRILGFLLQRASLAFCEVVLGIDPTRERLKVYQRSATTIDLAAPEPLAVAQPIHLVVLGPS